MSRTLPALAALLVVPAAWGQLAVSALSGMVNHIEGQVTLAGDTLRPKFAQFPQVAQGVTLATQDGRAEVLLSPGVFLRLGENSSFKMISNKLTDSQVELLTGAAIIEVQELLKDNSVTIVRGDAKVSLLKPGLYRFDDDPARLRVYDGKAQVANGSGFLTVTKGHETNLGAAVLAEAKFKLKDTDALYEWSAYRAALVAQANIPAARAANTSGYRASSSSWAYIPSWGMYTFLPMRGLGYSPFGWYVYSPYTVWRYYAPRYQPTYNNGGGQSASSGNWGGFGSSSSSAAAAPSSGGSMGISSGASSAPAAAPSGGRSR
jgi:hypothetical protein